MNKIFLSCFVEESFLIEGIPAKDVEDCHVKAHEIFLNTELTIESILAFLKVIEPEARLRDKPGMDVRVGDHIAPSGGPIIHGKLAYMISANAIERSSTLLHFHKRFLMLHPLTDGNGRTARAIWLHMAQNSKRDMLSLEQNGFLRTYYYKTLA